MNEQFPATDVQFTRLIQFRQVAYDLYRSSDATAVIAITFFPYRSIFLLTFPWECDMLSRVEVVRDTKL
jgi:hypothetical protein